MEYKQLIERLNGLGDATRAKYDDLQAMHKLYRSVTVDRPCIDSGLEKTLNRLSQETQPKVEVTTRGWIWKKDIYALTIYGHNYMSSEIDNMNRIRKDISKIKPYENLDKKIDEIMHKNRTDHPEYFAKKAILIDRALDKESANVFTSIKDVGTYLSGKLSNAEKKNKTKAEKAISKDASVASSGNSSDDMLTYMMLGGILMDDNNTSSSHSSSWFGSSGCGGGCGGGSVSSCGGGCGGGGCGGGGCGGGCGGG